MCGRIAEQLRTDPAFQAFALRDFALMLGALTLARLASVYDSAWTPASLTPRKR